MGDKRCNKKVDTQNFETTKEESSDSIGVVENKLENLTTKVVDNFLNANNLLKYLINATRQSFKAILLNGVICLSKLCFQNVFSKKKGLWLCVEGFLIEL